jgi:hypothetical protein
MLKIRFGTMVAISLFPSECPAAAASWGSRLGRGEQQGVWSMRHLSKGIVALVAVVVFAANALAVEAVGRGKVVSVDAAKNQFVVDENGKNNTFTLGDNVIINRGGKEIKFADIKPGDQVQIAYDKGLVTWTAHYVLVTDDANKTWQLGRGKVKAWDAKKNEMVLTDLNNKEWTFSVPIGSKVQVNTEAKKMDDIKVGEMVSIIYEEKEGSQTPVAHAVIAQRK